MFLLSLLLFRLQTVLTDCDCYNRKIIQLAV